MICFPILADAFLVKAKQIQYQFQVSCGRVVRSLKPYCMKFVFLTMAIYNGLHQITWYHESGTYYQPPHVASSTGATSSSSDAEGL